MARFMTDEEMRERFGLTESALRRLRATRDFPKRDALTKRTDFKAVDRYFDRAIGIEPHAPSGHSSAQSKERF